MDPGAQPDCRADGIAHARGRGLELALIAREIALATLLVLFSSAATADAYHWTLPRGFPTPAVPADNPMSDAKVALGRALFFDTRLSITGMHSCASCHEPARAFTDGLARARGATGDLTPNGAMSLVNVAYNVSFGWAKPNVTSLEAQMLEPLLNRHPVELGLQGRQSQIERTLSADASMRAAFGDSFGRAEPVVTFDRIVKAIATFERTLIFGHSPFDAYVFEGQHDALSPQARDGMALFYSERLGCGGCHSGFNFSGNWRDAEGITGPPSFADNGTSPAGAAPMRVPTLRNVALTAPFMHDGRFSTLEAVVDHYQRAGQRVGQREDQGADQAARDTQGRAREPRLRSFELTAQERAALISFLYSLGDPDFVTRFDEHQGTHPLPGR